jgi:PPOX class probable F420-dependent enzyme
VDPQQAREFLRTNHQAVMATLSPTGTPQLTPITASVDDEGYVTVSSRETAVKVKNLRRDPRVWLCVLTPQFFGDWVRVDGTAHIVDLPEAMDGLVDYYRGISGEHPDWDDYRAAMVRDQRVLVRITIERAGPDFHG